MSFRPKVDLANVRLLIADPNRHLVVVLAAVVRGFGIGEVRTVSDGSGAADVIRSGQANIVALHDDLDGVSAMSIAKTMREQIDQGELALILLSSRPTRSVVMSARDAGFDSVLARPFSPFDLHLRLCVIETIIRPARQLLGASGLRPSMAPLPHRSSGNEADAYMIDVKPAKSSRSLL